MNKVLCSVYIISCILFTSFNSIAQNDEMGVWIGASLDYKVSDKLDLSSKFQYRTMRFQFNKLYFSLQGDYQLTKNSRAFGGYRHSVLTNEYTDLNSSSFAYQSRFFAGFKFNLFNKFLKEKGLKHLKLKYRLLFQYETNKFKVNDTYLRNRLNLSYEIKKLDLSPFVAIESFYHFNQYYNYGVTEIKVSPAFDELRYKVGVDWKMNKKISIGLEGIYRSLVFQSDNDYIYKMSFKYSL